MSYRDIVASAQRKEILLPRLVQFLLQEQDKGAFDGEQHRQTVVNDAKMSIDCFQDRLEKYQSEDNLYPGYFHPSQLGTCMRMMWYDHYDAPQGTKAGQDILREHLIFEIGTYVHVLFQNLCERAGVMEAREAEVVNHSLKIVGHADGILKIDGERSLLEIKTIGSRGFTDLRTVKDHHKRQVTCYMKELGLTKALVVYICKDRSQCREFGVDFELGYWERYVKDRIASYFVRMPRRIPPAREGLSAGTIPCVSCAFKQVCYDSQCSQRFLNKIRPKLKLKL